MNNDARTKPDYPNDTGGMLRFLWSRTEADDLSDDELHWLSCATESAQLAAMNLGKTLASVAALVLTETDLKDAKFRNKEKYSELSMSGALQPYVLPEFLLAMAEIADTINEMVTIGSEAEFALRERWRKRAIEEGWKQGDKQERGNG